MVELWTKSPRKPARTAFLAGLAACLILLQALTFAVSPHGRAAVGEPGASEEGGTPAPPGEPGHCDHCILCPAGAHGAAASSSAVPLSHFAPPAA